MGTLKLANLRVPTKKKAFIEIMVPTAMIVREEIELKRSNIKKMIDGKSKKDEKYLSEMYKKYRVEDKNIKTLYKKMKPGPISILLAQASIESAWGTSRFFREGNNIFGVWSFRENEPRIKTSAMRGSMHVYLRKYGTLKESIEDYMLNLSRHIAYKEFRKTLETTSNYKALAPKLNKYSEEGAVYTKKVADSISYNKFYEYDNYEFVK
jgi:Bax protein